MPPVTHENDPIRGILSSLAICAELAKLGLRGSVGITSGAAFCGVVGHQGNRREYTVLGDIVNLSARLMQRAKSENGGVITDEATKLRSHDVLHFEERPQIMVKGKHDSIKIHRPYPRMSTLLEYHLRGNQSKPNMAINSPILTLHNSQCSSDGSVLNRPTPLPNVMENMHKVQVRDAQRRLSIRAESLSSTTDVIAESSHFLSIRSTLLEKCSKINALCAGGAFVLEGDIGLGKTRLIRTTMASPEAGDYGVVFASASPFNVRKECGVWVEIITKCALEAAGVDTTSSDLGSTRRHVMTYLKAMVEEGAAPNTKLVSYLYMLNDIMDTDYDEPLNDDAKFADDITSDNNAESDSFEEKDSNEEKIAQWFLNLLECDLNMRGSCDSNDAQTDDTKLNRKSNDSESNTKDDWELQERESEWRPCGLNISGVLLLCALHSISRRRVSIFALDNAMYMDEQSWVLTTIIAKYFTNCMMVVVTRPPSVAFTEHTASSSFRKQLRYVNVICSYVV